MPASTLGKPVGSDLQLRAKRLTDILIAAAGIAVLSPLMLAVAVWIRVQMGRPIIYGQLRPGLNEQPIRVWKFRTMTDRRDENGALMPDSERLTSLGLFLRRHSLDELPQLFNILRGEMSVVGPRPLLTRYLDRYTPRQRSRHRAKPGVTGWAQVNGRNALNWDSRLEFDLWYIDHFSLRLDFRIMALTCLRLFRKDDVLPGAGSELDEFWGAEGPPPSGPRAFPVEATEPWTDHPRWKTKPK